MGTLRVLILEDDEDIIELIRSILEPAYECYTAGNGMEGLQQAEEGQPDLIICDIMMPVMDGWEFVKRLRAIPGFERVPVIFLSALSAQASIREGYKLGAALYLTKPIDPARLRRNLDLFVKDHAIQARAKRMRIEQLKPYAVDLDKLLFSDLKSKTAPPAGTRAVTGTTAKAPSKALEGVPARAADKVPAKAAEPAPAPAAREKSKAINPLTGLKTEKSPVRVRIMIVEDDSDTSQMIHAGLVEQYEVLDAGDGIEAIERAVRYKPDLFIIDGMLPRMTGYQLTLMLKKNRDFYKSPIIFMSGKATQRDQQYVKSLGIGLFLAKPFTMPQLTQMVHEAIAAPDFKIHGERIDLKQIYLEQFQRVETHRASIPGNPTIAEIERRQLENLLKKQLH
jgi:CheY-like chemotaxis protein